MGNHRQYRPLSQVEIEEKIQAGMDLLEEATEEFRRLADEAADAETTYRSERAGAYLRASGSIKDRDMIADHVVKEQMRAFKHAEGRLKAQAEVLRTMRANLDAWRSLNTNVRAQV